MMRTKLARGQRLIPDGSLLDGSYLCPLYLSLSLFSFYICLCTYSSRPLSWPPPLIDTIASMKPIRPATTQSDTHILGSERAHVWVGLHGTQIELYPQQSRKLPYVRSPSRHIMPSLTTPLPDRPECVVLVYPESTCQLPARPISIWHHSTTMAQITPAQLQNQKYLDALHLWQGFGVSLGGKMGR